MSPTVLTFWSMLVIGQVVQADLQQQQSLCASILDFAQRLYQKIGWDKQTVVFSPAGVHSVLLMALVGARNETASEISQLLSLYSLPGSIPHNTYQGIIAQLKVNQEVTFGVGKAILVNPGKAIEEDFKTEIANKYSSLVDSFSLSAPGGAQKEINEYIAGKTQGLISDIIPKDSLSADTSLHLVTAIVANGTWQDKFDKSKTQKQDFFQLSGTKIQVDMMNDTRTLLLKRDNSKGVDVVQIPFKGGRFAFYIILPKRRDGMTDLESHLTQPGKLNELLSNLSPSYVQLVIPRFQIESSFQLKDSLTALGLNKAVTPGVADFSGISRGGNLHITEVTHRAIINIQESGVVTATPTAQEDEGLSSSAEEAEETFIANHPFIFLLKDNLSKLVLYQGKFSG